MAHNNTFFVAVKKNLGFTLIEMLLVMVIVSMIIVMGTRYFQQQAFNKRIERTTIQIQQILNASLSYYVANGYWPDNLDILQTDGYLPASPRPLVSPWGTIYQVKQGPAVTSGGLSTQVPMVYVWVSVTAGAATTGAATTIAGSLPLAYTTTSNASPPITTATCAPAATTCTVAATANVPGQNLNNANAVTFAGLYHNGACVPVPQCPVDSKGTTMTPEIIVVPVSVSGVNDPGDPANVYPLNSFTAYAKGPTNYTGSSGPPKCDSDVSGSDTNCWDTSQGSGKLATGVSYWRVCLQVVTSKGEVNWGQDTNSTNWGQYATVLAITRCGITNEPSGSSFNVWAP